MKQKGILSLLVLTLLAFVVTTLPAQTGATGRGRGGRTTFYDLEVRSNVRGATILIDGEEQDDDVPGTYRVESGERTVRVEADGYVPYEEVFDLTSDRTISVELEPITYRLRVTSNVRGATVSVNGREQRGSAPMNLTLEEGTYTVAVSANGYVSRSERVSLRRNRTVNFELEPITYRVRVNSNINDAVVYFYNRREGTAPLTEQLPECNYEIRVESEGYVNFTTTITVGSNTTVTANLQPALSTIVLFVPEETLRPDVESMADELDIFVDGQEVENPMEFRLRPGNRRIRVETGMVMFEDVFQISPSTTYRVTPRFFIELSR